MSQEQQIAVDSMIVPRSGSLDRYQETVQQAAVETTAVHLTPTPPSSTNLRQVRFDHLSNMWHCSFCTTTADHLLLVFCSCCRLRGLGQPSYDLLFEQSSTNTVHDPGVQKCTLQVRNYVHKGLCGVFTGNISTVKNNFIKSVQLQLGVWGVGRGPGHQHSLPAAKAVCSAAD